MITLEKGNILINGKVCNNPELLFFTMKDLAEESDHEFGKSYLCKKAV